MSNKICAIVQARTGSNRFPNKVLAELSGGNSMLWHVLNRVSKAATLDGVILATTTRIQDIAITNVAKELGIPFFVGSENNVLDRYYQCANKYDVNTIVRITGDCPLIDPHLIDRTVIYYLKNDFDYVSTCGIYPDGFDTEVFSLDILQIVWSRAVTDYDKEHVTSYIYKNKNFKCSVLPNNTRDNFNGLHLSVDTPEDLKVMKKLYTKLKENFTYEDVINLLKKEGKWGI